MKKLLEDLQGKVDVALVGGSDFSKISEQMNSGPDCKLVNRWMFLLYLGGGGERIFKDIQLKKIILLIVYWLSFLISF